MNASKRLLVNTIAQYSRTIINAILSLYSTRLVLSTLGVTDYGIFTVVGSVISMLSFMTSALSSTTQRFLSFNQRKHNESELKKVFSNCLSLHIFLGLLIVVVLMAITPLLFNGFLNIEAGREYAAEVVYRLVVIILLLTFITSPFRALLISRENIVYISFVDIIDGVIKVILVVWLTTVSYDKLITYGFIMLSIQVVNFLLMSSFCFVKYDECILPRLKYLNKQFCIEVSNFAGWTIYGVACLAGRAEGIAIILNRMLGAGINAAYGIGSQVSGYISFISESLKNAIKPQTIRAEGEGNRTKMIRLAETECKMAFFLMSSMAIPTIIEIPTLLTLWLGDVPDYAILFTRMFVLVSMVDALTTGLGTANQAVGRIRVYNIVIFTTKLMTMPVVWYCIKSGYSMYSVAIGYVAIEFLSTMLRLPVLKYEIGLSIKDFINNVFKREAIPFIIFILVNLLVGSSTNSPYRIFLTFGITIPIYYILIYFIGLTDNERSILKNILKKS